MFFEKTKLGKQMQKRDRASLDVLKYVNTNPAIFSDEELQTVPCGDVWTFDVESYPNYFCICFRHKDTGKVVYFEDSPDAVINTSKLLWMIWRFCIVGFFSNNYDMLMVMLASMNYKAKDLYYVTCDLIVDGIHPSEIIAKHRIVIPQINHIDLIEVAPLSGSLKLYGARLHCKRIQDLPFKPGSVLTKEEARVVLLYCLNDLEVTELLYLELCPQLELREVLGKQYGQDLRSKSDAQIAEAVVNSELKKLSGFWPKKPKFDLDKRIQYVPPKWVCFQTPALQAACAAICGASFGLDGNGSPVWPEGLGEAEKSKTGKTVWKLRVAIGKAVYKLGMGGLHSTEESQGIRADENTILADVDVASFYPRLILNERLFPKHLGEAFLKVYNFIVESRLSAKRDGIKTIAETLKIVINGLFGKFGNKYSSVYSPDLMLQVTITGQLALLMLIEALELIGIPIVSGNTDGIVIKCPVNRYDDLKRVVKAWEKQCGLETEETRYAAIYSKDVNNYYALKYKFDKKAGEWTKEIEGCKLKGVYSEKGSALNSVLSKNPECYIVSKAVQEMILHDKPIEQTIYNCKDIKQFVSVKNARGGGEKDGVYLGKVVRWYYAEGESGHIRLVDSGNAVGKSEGGRPLMELPPELPNDINYDWYVNKATKTLYDIGYYAKPQMSLF